MVKILEKFLDKIFSIKFTENKKHKLITFLGIKIKVRADKFFNQKEKNEYREYLENYTNDYCKTFVPLSEKSYNNTCSVKPVAFYLPQFHTIELNDKIHGRGFTEWTNVTKATPQFKDHYQPHLPIDVGFYDLSTDKVMYRQIELAKKYGIYGFCFHYYWFSGRRLLEKPIFNYLNNKGLDFPFMLCWANENWSKLWDGGDKEVIVEQKLNDDDDEKFFYDILPFLKDERYIKIGNSPVLIIYRLNLFEKERTQLFIKNIKTLAKKEGLDDIIIVGARVFNCNNPIEYGADKIVEFPPHETDMGAKYVDYQNPNFAGHLFDVEDWIKNAKYIKESTDKLFKTVFPNWDNTARKARSHAFVLQSTPELYKKWLSDVIKWTKENHNENEQLLFINAWNEWAEGAHLEPDAKYGYAYLEATKEALEENP